MQIAYSLEEIPGTAQPVVLTIGNFDGVHLGHQALLKHLLQTARKQKALSAVLTFSNHPSTILRPNHSTPLLCSTEHKIQLLKSNNVDITIALPFTKVFSEQSADLFLHNVQKTLPFQTLILGSDAHIGKNREGDRTTVTALSKQFGFHVDYFPDYEVNGHRISSSQIRECIREGHLVQTKNLLGRCYSIYGQVLKGSGRGADFGFPTANLDVNGLCLPPLGVYAVSLLVDGKEYQGVANLGIAPTVRQEADPILEVHLIDKHFDLYGKYVEVFFHEYIRPEVRFESIEMLKMQIAQDVLRAREILL